MRLNLGMNTSEIRRKKHLRIWRHGMETFLDKTLLNQILKYVYEDFKKENSWLLNCDKYSLVHLFIYMFHSFQNF